MKFPSRLWLGVVAVLPFAVGIAEAQSKKDERKDVLTKKDTQVEPTSWGNVFGRVYDASSGAPIKGAEISIQTEDGFLDRGRSVGKTNELGGYRAQCVLGRISHNFDVGRALLSTGIGILFGSATNTTKRIDVSRIAIRVHAPGYKSYEGALTARGQDARAFRIDMEPVLLIPESESGVSVSAMGWHAVRVEAAAASPTVAHKGDKVKLTALVRAFGKEPQKHVEIAAVSKLWRGERRMKINKEASQGDLIAFETEYAVTGREKSRVEPVGIFIRRSVLDYQAEAAGAVAVIQISTSEEEDKLAVERTAALTEILDGKAQAAQGRFAGLAKGSPATQFDLHMLAYTSERSSNYEAAANAWEQLLFLEGGEDALEVAGFVRTLYAAKRYDQVISLVESELKGTKPRNWPEAIDANTVGHLGLAHVRSGSLERAGKLNEDLLQWPESGLDPAVIEFRSALRLAEVEKVHEAQPNSADALADYGRALLDLGRFEEAVAKLKASLDVEGQQPAVQRDLTWAALQMQGELPKQEDLAAAVATARAALNLDAGKQRSKDFFSWNQYAILLYSLSEQLRASGDSAAEATNNEAIDALREALRLGRTGAKHNAGIFTYSYGYATGSEVAISGFAYPQANASFVLLQSLKRLRKAPDNHLALFDQASSLMDLGQINLAEARIQHLLTLRPEFGEAIFLSGLIKARLGDHEAARAQMDKVLAQNPRHPRANLILADLLAKDGEVAASAERLAVHAKYYGNLNRLR